MLEERSVSIFRDGRDQAVSIPRDFELPGTQALMRKEGDSLIITPVRSNRLLAMLAAWGPLEEDFPEVEDLPPQARDIC